MGARARGLPARRDGGLAVDVDAVDLQPGQRCSSSRPAPATPGCWPPSSSSRRQGDHHRQRRGDARGRARPREGGRARTSKSVPWRPSGSTCRRRRSTRALPLGLHAARRPRDGAAETRRVLRPGGRVALAAWDGAGGQPVARADGRVMVERGLVEPPAADTPGAARARPAGADRGAARRSRLRRHRGRAARPRDPRAEPGRLVGPRDRARRGASRAWWRGARARRALQAARRRRRRVHAVRPRRRNGRDPRARPRWPPPGRERGGTGDHRGQCGDRPAHIRLLLGRGHRRRRPRADVLPAAVARPASRSGLAAVQALLLKNLLSAIEVADQLNRFLPDPVHGDITRLVLGTRSNSPQILAVAVATMLWTMSGAIGVVERCESRMLGRLAPLDRLRAAPQRPARRRGRGDDRVARPARR